MKPRTAGITLVMVGGLLAGVTRADLPPEDRLLSEIYPQGGPLLYCPQEFGPGDRIRVDRIYPERQMYTNYGCRSARTCREPAFENAVADLHNLFPIARSSDIKRRGTKFSEVPDNVAESECGFRVSFQNFQPPPGARGDVARAMIYMHVRHELPLIGVLDMYQRWSDADPPDEHERRRNDAIERVQGNRNSFIDNPGEVHNVELTLPPTLY